MPPSPAHRSRTILPIIATLVCGLALAMPGFASAGWMDAFKDPEDGKFDLTRYLLDRKGALPVPILITEPAVGLGGGGALMFFQQSLAERARSAQGRYRPPNVYGVAGFGTENGTWGTGGGGMMSLADDRWRVRGGGGYIDANLDFFGIGAASGSTPFAYSLAGYSISSTALYRLKRTDGWFAMNFRYLDLESQFETGPVGAVLDGTRTSSGIGPSFEFDSRDNLFTASRGFLAAVDAMFYGEAIGSDVSFQTYRARTFAYVPAGPVVFGTRVDGRSASQGTPFYMMPYLQIRGIPAVRYQGRTTALIEEEVRWNVDPRWALTGFYGIGRAWGEQLDFEDADAHGAGGGGFRYLLAREMGIYSGVDFAWGPEFAFYLVVGNAWR